MMLRPKEVVCKWVDAFNGHDVDAIVSLYHDNATNHQVTNEPVIGIDAIREMFTAEFAEYLDGIENAVCARIGLNQAVHFQVFIHPQRIQRRGVKAGQEHIDHDQQVKFLVLHAASPTHHMHK